MLTVDRLREVLNYEPETGVFTWRRPTHPRIRVGAVAGRKMHTGDGYYWQIKIDRRHYYAHRLAFLYMTGEWPTQQVDHKDRVGTNNAWSNLREASSLQNKGNVGRSRNNRSGFKGVYWHAQSPHWRAVIGIGGKRVTLGTFDSPLAASRAYDKAAAQVFGEFARLNLPAA